MSERFVDPARGTRLSTRVGARRGMAPADDRPVALLLGADWPAPLGEDIAVRALLEGRALGAWTHVTDRTPSLAAAATLRELADVYSAVDFAHADEWVAWAKSMVAGGARFDMVFDIGSRSQQAAAEVAAEIGAPGNDPKAVQLVGDKDRCRAALSAAGFVQPSFRLCADRAEAAEFLRDTRGPWIVKPRQSAGGNTVSLVRRPVDLTAALARLPADQDFLVEQFVRGREFSAEGVFLDGESHILAVAEKQLDRGPRLRTAARVLPADLPAFDLAEVENTVVAALRDLALSFGAFHVGLWLTDAGVVLGTVKARLGGGWTHVLLAHAIPDLELCGLIYADALGHPATAQPLVAQRAAAVRFLMAPSGRFVRVEEWRRVLDHPAVLRAELFVEPGALIDAEDGGYVGMIIVAARTPGEATTVAADLAGSSRVVVEPIQTAPDDSVYSEVRRIVDTEA